MKKCLTHGCKNEAIAGNYCFTCISKKYRERHPVRSAYLNLKNNAKRRNKSFTLTFEQFESMCAETDYIRKKGHKKRSYTIDRIDEQGGYSIDNIQILTNSKNVKKFLDYRYNGGKMEFKTVTLKPAVIDNCPF